MPLRSIAFLLYFFGSAGASLLVPIAGVLCYIVLYNVYPQSTWWGKYLEPLGIRYAYVIAACLTVGVIVNLNRLRYGRQVAHPVEWGMLLVFLSMLMSGVTGVAWNERTDFVIDKMWKVFLFAFMMSHVVVTRRHVWLLLIVFTVMSLYLGYEAKNAPPGAFLQNRLDGIGGPDFRESTGLAIHLLALLPFTAVLLWQKYWRFRVLAFFAACYGVNAILLCRARSAFIAGLVAGLTAVWYVPRRYRSWAACVLVLGLLGSVKLSDQWFWERMKTIVSSREEREVSSAARLLIWASAWEMIKDRPLGVGIGQFQRMTNRYTTPELRRIYGNPATESVNMIARDAHNSFILCAAETGIPGLACFLLTLIMAWGTLSRLRRRARRYLSDPAMFEMLVFANRMALLVYLVGGMFTSRFYTEGFWWMVILPVCLKRAVENEIRDEVCEKATVRALLDDWIPRGDRLQPELVMGGQPA
ncbi:MAG TPA: O-antigen ligase family protein [Phycisphaerae bacterium]|nr:O-antigen ligase family protein [Phycisphaerae bacterium]HRR85199.1 O-antigen ligase family protein [Phycisphaerae bacterium]